MAHNCKVIVIFENILSFHELLSEVKCLAQSWGIFGEAIKEMNV